jgi:hypothetical protein
MKWHTCFIALTLAFASVSALAKENPFSTNNGEFLVESCREVLEIYQNRTEKRLLAGQRTSVPEAMRAGYCMGVVQQYLLQSHSCGHNFHPRGDWFALVTKIAGLSFGTQELSRDTSSLGILQKAYCHG